MDKITSALIDFVACFLMFSALAVADSPWWLYVAVLVYGASQKM